jgi:hypothetical protein
MTFQECPRAVKRAARRDGVGNLASRQQVGLRGQTRMVLT